jgi:hypothetical protein
VNPVLPEAVTVITPFGVPHGVALVVVAESDIDMPPHTEGLVMVNCLLPVHPLLFFAVMVYVPAARLLKTPDD